MRLSLARPGAEAAELLELAPRAEHWNLAGLWIGDPRGGAANADDSYVTATAAAVSAVTRDLRLGLFLGAGIAGQLVRIAEDVAVVDQASGGRVEIAFVPPADRGDDWLAGVAKLLRAWHEWQLPGTDETVPVLPGPAQPVVPRLVVGDAAAADALGAGRVLFEPVASSDRLVPPRTILVVDVAPGVQSWLASGALERVLELRERAQAAAAQELLLVASGPLSDDDVRALGTVLVPSLRAAARDVRAIASDSWRWLTEKTELHAPPA